ncbi:hypothetical protein [Spirosoma sordidisoli]|nr:hypothetical protein [Spirosoma sordidisoli]
MPRLSLAERTRRRVELLQQKKLFLEVKIRQLQKGLDEISGELTRLTVLD